MDHLYWLDADNNDAMSPKECDRHAIFNSTLETNHGMTRGTNTVTSSNSATGKYATAVC